VGRVELVNLQGSVKQTLPFADTEGSPVLLDICGFVKGSDRKDFMVCATKNSVLKLWDVSRREPKQIVAGRRFDVAGPGGASISSVRVSCNGSSVSILRGAAADPMVYVYDADADAFHSYDCSAQRPGRIPVSHYWDAVEPRLLAVEVKTVRGPSAADDTYSSLPVGSIEILTLLVTAEKGLLLQDSFVLEKDHAALLGPSVPFIHFASKPESTESSLSGFGASAAAGAVPRVKSKVMRDFVGMEEVDETTRSALLNFSYCLTIGNMDDAYKAVKLIESTAVWQNMAHMCVKTKRLDVAEVCLGQMGHARGARALREAKEEPELDAQIAMVAIHLGLNDDAERLYKECSRFDLLNNLYQSSGQWDKAIDIAEKKDRIHLRSTRYAWAKHLEAMGNISDAIRQYELAEAHRTEVPRMLYDLQQVEDLEAYIKQCSDKKLFKWWGQYSESIADFDSALRCYDASDDVLSLVRVLCFRGDFERAEEKVASCSGPQAAAAAYHLARQYEGQNKPKKAIEFFSQAGRFNHAIRLAKECSMDSELMNLALRATPRLMADAAKYFEEREMFDKAVLLQQKSGQTSKALDMCIRTQRFETLKSMTEDLGPDTPPEMLEKAAEFFLEQQQYDKACHLLLTGKQVKRGLELCMQHNVHITDEMAEQMTPEKQEGDENSLANQQRIEVLRAIAKMCKRQGSFHLATKKYTQAGLKVKAMKCLIKSGDTEKIVFFAGLSRHREIYILGANYLQTLDWHSDAEIMKNIIQFYTKAKAFDSLALFYDACAQVEIDEYRDYEKALNALRESLKYLSKGTGPENAVKAHGLQARIDIVEKFVNARRLMKTDTAEMLSKCHELLDATDVESGVRVGDVFALLIEYYHAEGSMEFAYGLIEKMRERGIILAPYLDQEMVEQIYAAMGIDAGDDVHGAGDSAWTEEILEDD
jgi:intraflagellar transport protein 140